MSCRLTSADGKRAEAGRISDDHDSLYLTVRGKVTGRKDKKVSLYENTLKHRFDGRARPLARCDGETPGQPGYRPCEAQFPISAASSTGRCNTI